MNDPWQPQPNSGVVLQAAPIDPLHQMISSDRYLDSLEKKLGRIKGRNTTKEPTSQDIVKSLSKFKDDQMERFLKGERTHETGVASNEVISASYLQRKLHPDKQPITEEELLELLKEDVLSRRMEEEEEMEELAACVAMATVTKQQNAETNETKSDKFKEKGNEDGGNIPKCENIT